MPGLRLIDEHPERVDPADAGSAGTRLIPWALALAAGSSWALSMPPWGLWPLSFLVVPLLGASLVLGPQRWTQAFLLGLAAGTTAFLGILTWATNIEPGGAIAWPLLSLIQGIYVGLFALLVRPVLVRRWVAMPALGLGWVGLEVVRGGFPEDGFGWAQFAYTHVDGSWLAPLARIGGGHLITLFVALMGAAVFEAWRQGRDAVQGLQGPTGDVLQAMLPHAQRPLFWLAGVLFASVLLTIEPPPPVDSLDVLVVQGNDLEGSSLVGAAKDLAIAERHLELTRQALEQDGVPDVVVWPESSIDLDPFGPGGDAIRAVLQEAGRLAEGGLVVGIRRDGPSGASFRNTVSSVDADGAIVDTYDKRQLVPFGEYVPARGIFGGIGPLKAIPQDGIAGVVPTHLEVTGEFGPVDLAVAICFETLFGHTIRDNILGDGAERAAGVIIATTNDASFGRGSEPAQHLAQSQLRAIETGRWVVHAAITGSSAFVDPQGRVHQATELFVADTIRRDIPVVTDLTPYLATGDIVGKIGLLALLAIVILRSVEGALDRAQRSVRVSEDRPKP